MSDSQHNDLRDAAVEEFLKNVMQPQAPQAPAAPATPVATSAPPAPVPVAAPRPVAASRPMTAPTGGMKKAGMTTTGGGAAVRPAVTAAAAKPSGLPVTLILSVACVILFILSVTALVMAMQARDSARKAETQLGAVTKSFQTIKEQMKTQEDNITFLANRLPASAASAATAPSSRPAALSGAAPARPKGK